MSSSQDLYYSPNYADGIYEYRHVILPSEMAANVPRTHRMTETEWRNLGIQQSTGWVHYLSHNPEPHVICFRRKKKVEPNPAESVPKSS